MTARQKNDRISAEKIDNRIKAKFATFGYHLTAKSTK